jgi:hypothetical protein
MTALYSERLVRWSGLAGLLGGLALAAGQLSFWLVVPESDAAREDRQAAVFATAVLWLVAHVLLAAAIAGVYARVYRRVGAFGGAGAIAAIFGTIGVSCYTFFLFPELIGFRPDTIDRAQIALALQAIGELGAASLLGGLFLLSLSLVFTRAFAPAAGAVVLTGTLVAPFGLEDPAWLALGACLIATGIAWIGALLATGRATATRPDEEAWPPSQRKRQFRF